MIIGFHGVKGSGKDTAAQYLIDNYNFQKVALADILKEAVANLMTINLEEIDELKETGVVKVLTYPNGPMSTILTWREFLQRFGTEMGRNTFGKDFWVNQWEEYLYRNSMQDDDIVVTDVRFQNEAYKIQRLGEPGIVIRITRPGYTSDGHASEEPLPDILIDGEILNDGSIMDLHEDVLQLYTELRDNVNV